MQLDAGTILLQWATGGLAFLWVTSRRRQVSLGYGWLLRSVYGVLALGAIGAEVRSGHTGTGRAVFIAASSGLVLAALVALAVSVVRRSAGVSGARARAEESAARVAAMTGDDAPTRLAIADESCGPEFPPALDLVAPMFGMVGLVAAATFVGGSTGLAAARLLVGAAFLGVVTDAMLLGHWYLTQPGLARDPLKELVRWSGFILPVEVFVLLLPPGMIGVVVGNTDDGYNGLLGWMWVVCALTTGVLLWITWLALRERFYSAVMAATGLLYLAILTAFGTDLVARAVLAPLSRAGAAYRDAMKRMRQGVALMTVVVSLVALGAARPSRRDAWDPRIAPIARQVQRLRHLDFEHPVEAVFLTDKAFRKRVTSDEEKLTKQDRRELRVGEAELRALGLVSSDFDLLATVDEVAGEGILAYYDSEKENIVVRGKKLDAEARVTLVHELTHALQDQHYDLDELQDHIETSGADDALTALLEGDATRIEGDYYWDLSRKERALIDEAEGTDGPLNPDESPADAGEGFVGAQVESPYALGPPMVDIILADGGRKGLAAAFRKPPTSQLALLSPTIAVDPPAKVRLRRPVVPMGARRIDLDYPDDMGALDLFFLLASRLPNPIALRAADAWGNGKELLTRQGSDTCVDLSFVGRTRGGSARIADALRLWAAAMPAGSVELSKNGRTLHACDPGDAAAAPPRSAEDALTFVAARAYLTGEFVDGDAPTVIARCLGEKMIDRPEFQAMATPEGFAAEPTDEQVDDVSAMVDQLIEVCI